jgi:mannose-1-phosphate guanylyltransferase/mannose-6-phosphate isomerase
MPIAASNQKARKLIPVILSGGMGKRLWPLSRKSYPKQFLHLGSDAFSLFEETLLRLDGCEGVEAPMIVCNEEHRFIVAEKLHRIGRIEGTTILLEPTARDTAAATAAAAAFIQQIYGEDSLMMVLPSDHLITGDESFVAGVAQARALAETGYLTTFGIKPDRPETGYGYIKYGASLDGDTIFTVEKFVEKPDARRAGTYLQSGHYLWNSGMFCLPVAPFLSELALFQPEIAARLPALTQTSVVERDYIWLDRELFSQMPDLSIDYAVMEHTKKAAVIPLECGWTDAGSWDALWELKEKDAQGNVLFGEGCHEESANCYIWAEDGPAVTTLGVKDTVIIATKDCTLVADKKHLPELKNFVKKVEQKHPDLVREYRQIYRPWGHYDRLDVSSRHKVKRITVNPGASLSLQRHFHRHEYWVVISGQAHVQIDDGHRVLHAGESLHIAPQQKHRIHNRSKEPLMLIEIQTGEYLGEDDIQRLEDSYGRVEEQSRADKERQ